MVKQSYTLQFLAASYADVHQNSELDYDDYY